MAKEKPNMNVVFVGHVDAGKSTIVGQLMFQSGIVTEQEMKKIPVSDYHQINIGFENTLNKALDLISSEKWQKKYEGGYFLFLFKSAMQRQIIEISFISCSETLTLGAIFWFINFFNIYIVE